MTQDQKAILVMDYLRDLGTEPEDILEAICDENMEESYKLIKENPKISKAEFLRRMPRLED